MTTDIRSPPFYKNCPFLSIALTVHLVLEPALVIELRRGPVAYVHSGSEPVSTILKKSLPFVICETLLVKVVRRAGDEIRSY